MTSYVRWSQCAVSWKIRFVDVNFLPRNSKQCVTLIAYVVFEPRLARLWTASLAFSTQVIAIAAPASATVKRKKKVGEGGTTGKKYERPKKRLGPEQRPHGR